MIDNNSKSKKIEQKMRVNKSSPNAGNYNNREENKKTQEIKFDNEEEKSIQNFLSTTSRNAIQ